jgi:hypothetical protein
MLKRSRVKRKSDHQRLVEDADAWVKSIVLNRQGGICLRTGYPSRVCCGGGLQGAHILRKGGIYAGIRYDLENVIVLCRNHHLYWAHLHELEFYEWIENLYPGRIERLKQSAMYSRKIDLQELICVLKDIHAKESDPPSRVLPISQDLADSKMPF